MRLLIVREWLIVATLQQEVLLLAGSQLRNFETNPQNNYLLKELIFPYSLPSSLFFPIKTTDLQGGGREQLPTPPCVLSRSVTIYTNSLA